MSDEYQECGRGHRCAQAAHDPATGETTGVFGPRVFCDPCADHITTKLRDLPVVYRELREVYGDQPTRGGDDDVRIKVSKVHPSIPVRGDLDALCTEIETTLEAYEDRVRQLLGMGPAPVTSWAHRADRVEQACTLLAGHTSALFSLPMEWMRIDGSHDERGGRDAGLDVLDLHRRAYAAAGRREARWVIPAVCPSCRFPALVRTAGVEGATCEGCGYVVGVGEYEALTAALAEVARAA